MKGKILNSFTLKSFLGKGGMAEVWYAENNLGRGAAIKIMLPQFMGMEQVTSRFEAEAKAMVQLNHPSIRQVMDFGEYEGRPFIIMEYLEGEDLNTALRSGRKFNNAELKIWWKQCVSALKHTHSNGIIHRDIKPSNIFLQKTGDVKILDFGIAKVKDEISHTITGQALGTVMFMSPEQITDPKRVTTTTDIYSLGITFAHLLKGKSPFNITKDDSSFAIQRKIVDGELDLSGIPDEWLGVINSAITSNASDRRLIEDFKSSYTNDATEAFNFKKEYNPSQESESNRKTKFQSPKEDTESVNDSQRPKPSISPKEKKTNPLLYIIPLVILLIGGLMYFLLENKDEVQIVQPESSPAILINVPFEENGLYGYKRGDSIVITPKFTEANNFSNGRALVKTDDSVFYINHKGETVQFVSLLNKKKGLDSGKKEGEETSVKKDDFDSNKQVTLKEDYFIDSRDNEKYKIKKIGNKIWMVENFRYKSPGSINYDGSSEMGRLYQWKEASQSAPTGWRLPTKKEFEALIMNLGGRHKGEDRYVLNSSKGFNVLVGKESSSAAFYSTMIPGHSSDFDPIADFWSSTSSAWSSNVKYHYIFRPSKKDVYGVGELITKAYFSVRYVKDSD